MEEQGLKSGFVTIIGRPNVGKSSLVNQIMGRKIAIMSDKPQTTRNTIRAIHTDPERGQIVFIDTPGIHRPKSKLGSYMMDMTLTSLKEVDLILYIIDVTKDFGPGEEFILEQLNNIKDTPFYLILNKIDLVAPEALLPIIENYRDRADFTEIIPLSAKYGDNVENLMNHIYEILPEGPNYYPVDQTTDYPEGFIVAELIREKLLDVMREEVPHSLAVVVESMKRGDNNPRAVAISAIIYVERNSQKGIIIGKNGSMLKEIGQRARADIEKLLGTKTYLELWVKVEEDWRNQDRLLKELGYTIID